MTEFILVFCLLWFCCDYMIFMAKWSSEPLGYDIKQTYLIRMQLQDQYKKEKDFEVSPNDKLLYTKTLTYQLEQYPGIEYISFSSGAIPWFRWAYYSGHFYINGDSIHQSIPISNVTPDFFNVFRIKLTKGRFFDTSEADKRDEIIISPNRNGLFGAKGKEIHPIEDIKICYNIDHPYTIIGFAEKSKIARFEPYNSVIYEIIHDFYLDISTNEIAIRVNPKVDKNFKERFMNDMKEKLNIGPYKLGSISSFEEMHKKYISNSDTTNNLKSIYSITLFLIMNIFLGLIGTFWYRTQARKAQIGLRIAMGSSRRKIKTFLYTETLILLFIAAFIGVNICININQTDLLEAMGIPKSDPTIFNTGIKSYFINFGATFLFMATVSLLAVWYPAQKASNRPPAEALHND